MEDESSSILTFLRRDESFTIIPMSGLFLSPVLKPCRVVAVVAYGVIGVRYLIMI
jgi:hypothetical protein